MTTLEILAIRVSPASEYHSHIADYRWRNRDTGTVGESNKPTMVKWLDDNSGVAYVGSGRDQVRVHTAHPNAGAAYLQTYADGKWTNNLLALPRF